MIVESLLVFVPTPIMLFVLLILDPVPFESLDLVNIL
jgi:hypothetical protein